MSLIPVGHFLELLCCSAQWRHHRPPVVIEGLRALDDSVVIAGEGQGMDGGGRGHKGVNGNGTIRQNKKLK